jgi:hypothetical protein
MSGFCLANCERYSARRFISQTQPMPLKITPPCALRGEASHRLHPSRGRASAQGEERHRCRERARHGQYHGRAGEPAGSGVLSRPESLADRRGNPGAKPQCRRRLKNEQQRKHNRNGRQCVRTEPGNKGRVGGQKRHARRRFGEIWRESRNRVESTGASRSRCVRGASAEIAAVIAGPISAWCIAASGEATPARRIDSRSEYDPSHR